MKVVRSVRLTQLLRDPVASERLRTVIAEAMGGRSHDVRIAFTDDQGRPVTVVPRLVDRFGNTVGQESPRG